MTDPAFTQPNATTYRVRDLVHLVESGRVRIPPFQRGLRWQWEDVRRLFDSILRGYPIGSLLLWRRPAPAADVKLGALKLRAPANPEALWVVDGQQRLTSLANALTEAGSSEARFALAYDLEAKDEAKKLVKPSYDAPLRLPLPVLFDLQRLLKWFAAHPEASEHLDEATRVARALNDYALPASIVQEQDEAVLRDIFDRMNNFGHRLSRAEVFTALHTGQESTGQPPSFESLAERLDAQSGFGRIDDDTILRAFLARRGADVTREIRTEFDGSSRGARDFADETKEQAFARAEDALARAISFLQDDAQVPHFGFLAYRYLLVVLTRFFAHHPSPGVRNRELLRRWFWRSAMLGPSIARGAYTSAMRSLGSAVIPGDEAGSIRSLLEALGCSKPSFAFPERFKSTMAEARFVLCALWALGPRSPQSGDPYDRTKLAAVLGDRATATEAVEIFFARAAGARGATASRVILLDDDASGAPEGLFSMRPATISEDAWAEVLRSHALEPELVDPEANMGVEAFLDQRKGMLEQVTRRFLERQTESDFEDTPPLDELDLDDDPPDPSAHALS